MRTKMQIFSFKKCIWKCPLQNVGHSFCSDLTHMVCLLTKNAAVTKRCLSAACGYCVENCVSADSGMADPGTILVEMHGTRVLRSIGRHSLEFWPSPPGQNGRNFADVIFKCIFLNENVWISNKFSMKFVTKGPINNIPAMVQTMAWRRSGDKPLSEPMMVSLYWRIYASLGINELKACHVGFMTVNSLPTAMRQRFCHRWFRLCHIADTISKNKWVNHVDS